jgi:tetratricopeptide (TPR) repeat protein
MRLLLVMSFFMLFVSGCANIEPIERANQSTRYGERAMRPQVVTSRVLPQLPEVQAPVSRVLKPYRYNRATDRAINNRAMGGKIGVKPKPLKSRYKVKVKPKNKAPVIQRYPSGTSPQVSTLPAAEPSAKNEGVEIDPYASIPENMEDKQIGSISTRPSSSSPAVEALLVRAYADAKLGRIDVAMIKLERGLRIEPQNPKLWNQLAELHYKKGNYQQAITMVKKAINFSSNNEEMTTKNWRLLSDVAQKSGDSSAMAEVNEYNKQQ